MAHRTQQITLFTFIRLLSWAQLTNSQMEVVHRARYGRGKVWSFCGLWACHHPNTSMYSATIPTPLCIQQSGSSSDCMSESFYGAWSPVPAPFLNVSGLAESVNLLIPGLSVASPILRSCRGPTLSYLISIISGMIKGSHYEKQDTPT